MHLITAYIRPERLNLVKQALVERKVFKISVTNALGCGDERSYHEKYRGVDIEVDLYKRVRLEIAVNDEFVDPTIEAIVEGAKTGENGDGKIFVTPLERVIRIRSGETDNAAIG